MRLAIDQLFRGGSSFESASTGSVSYVVLFILALVLVSCFEVLLEKWPKALCCNV